MKRSIVIKLFVLFFSTIHFISCTQSKKIVVKTYPFYTIQKESIHPKGGIEDAAVENINSIVTKEEKLKTFTLPSSVVDTIVIVYLETTEQSFNVGSVWQNDNILKITSILLVQNPFLAGYLKGGNQVIISKDKANFLYQLTLLPKILDQFSANRVYIKINFKGKIYTLKTERLVEIIPFPAS